MYNSILSLLVCLAMMLSGASVSETPEAISSRTLTISDLVVSIGDEEFAIDPTLSIGVQTENNAALLDFSVGCGEDALFPIQAKIDESGATILVDDASTAYTFTPELMGLSELPEEAMLVLEPLMRMLADVSNLYAQENAMNMAANAKLNELFAGAEMEETTYTIDGVEVPATHGQVTLEHDDVMALYDAMTEAYDGVFFDAYFDLLNNVNALSTLMLDDETEIPEVHSFSDLFSMASTTLSIDLDDVSTKDGLREMDMTLNFTVESDGEPAAFSLPVHILATEPGMLELSINVALPEDAGELLMTASSSANAYSTSMNMQIADDDATGSLLMTLDGSESADGSTTNSLSYLLSFDADETPFNVGYAVTSVTDAQGLSESDVAMSFDMVDLGFYGVSFHTSVANTAIVDRIADKPVKVLTTEDDLENASGLALSLMGLSADLEKLMEEPSVAAMIDALSVYETVESETAEIEEVYSDGTDDPSVLSFAIPEFNLPEGYILDQQYIYGEYDSASLVYSYEREDIVDHPDIFIDLYADENAFVDYVLDDSGALVMPEGRVVSIMETDGYAYASVELDGVQCSISVYSDTIFTEIVAEILKGL